MSEVNTSELARMLGVSRTAVQKANRSGRITPSSLADDGSPRYDSETVLQQWSSNTNHSKKRAHKEGGRPRKDGHPTRQRADIPDEPLADKLVPPVGGDEPLHPMRPGYQGKGTLKTGGEPHEPMSPRGPGGEEQEGGTSYNEAARREKFYKAELARLEYEQKIGALIPIANVQKEVEREYTRVRARLLAIPTKLAPEVAISDDVGQCRAIIDAAITDALNELAADITGAA